MSGYAYQDLTGSVDLIVVVIYSRHMSNAKDFGLVSRSREDIHVYHFG